MTKAGPDGPKARARRRSASGQGPYTRALRNPSPPNAADPLYPPGTDPIAWDARRTWRCFQCGATGEEFHGSAGSLFVLDDGVTYLRGHCRTCLPEPKVSPLSDRPGGPWPSEWVRYRAAALRLDQILSDTAYRGMDLRAFKTDAFVCSVCGCDWVIARRVVLPVEKAYNNAGPDEHPCPTCILSLDEEVWRAEHQARVAELSGPNPADYDDGERYADDRARWAGQEF